MGPPLAADARAQQLGESPVGSGARRAAVDDRQNRLVRVGLVALADYGFALAGGYALPGERPRRRFQVSDRSSDGATTVDLATDLRTSPLVGLSVAGALRARRRHRQGNLPAGDYFDLAFVLASGRGSRRELIVLS